MTKKKHEITVWTTFSGDDTQNALPSFTKGTIKAVQVTSDTLAKNLESFLSNLESVIQVNPPNDSPFYIDQMELNLAVNASGGIELLGKLEGGAQAGIKITLKRKEH